MLRSKMLIYLIGLVFLCPFYGAKAQSYEELAAIFSNTNAGGTARVQGMAGVQSSLGGDISLSNSNPAGLGMATKSSLTFSGNISGFNTNGSYYGSSLSDSKSSFNIPQLGVIIYKPGNSEDNPDYRGGAVAINVTRTNSFNESVSFAGVPDNSLIDYYLSVLDQYDPYTYDVGYNEYNSIVGLGWETFLIDTLRDVNNNLAWNSLILDYPSQQGEVHRIRGSQYTWNFAYGGNYKDMVFFGGGIGLATVRYSSEKTFHENFNTNSPSYTIESFSMEETLNVTGTGLNVNFGVTVRPVDIFQVSLAYTSPTVYNINDQWKATINTRWDGFFYEPTQDYLYNENHETELIVSDYKLTTPSKISAGGTLFFDKIGFLSADIERVDYSGSRLKSSLFSMDGDNQVIAGKYSKGTNIRVGGELRKDIFRLRAGYGLKSNPLTGQLSDKGSVKTMSMGFGFYKEDKFVDFAIIKSNYQSSYFPYLIDGQGTPAVIDHKRINIMATFGFVF